MTDYAPFGTTTYMIAMAIYSLCCKKASKQSFSILDMFISICAGGIAGCCVDLAFFPIDTIKTRIQASSSKIDMTKEASDTSFFQGILSPMLVAFPCSGAYILVYDFTQSTLKEAGFPFFVYNFLATTMSECSQELIRNPSEVVK